MWAICLWVFSLGAIVSGALVITSPRPQNAIICLILAFINGIGAFILLGTEFLALIYCIVYVGAIAILFLFVVMLLSGSEKEGTRIFSDIGTLDTASANPMEKLASKSNLALIYTIGVLYLFEIWCGAMYWSFGGMGNVGAYEKVSSFLYNRRPLEAIGECFYLYGTLDLLIGLAYILLVGMIGSIVLTLPLHENPTQEPRKAITFLQDHTSPALVLKD